jgi:hydrogenase/urease accessory protein HupE
VAFPAPPNLAKASPQSLLSARTTMAYVIIALAAWILVDAIRAKPRGYLVPACTGIAGVLVAYASGLAYYDTESDAWSVLMTIGFAVAVTSCALAGRRWLSG